MTRPSFATTIRALALTDPARGIRPADDEADVAEVLRHVEAEHRGAAERDIDADTWGICSTCATPWPCEAWAEAEHLAVQYLGRAQDRAAAHARQALDRLRRRPAC